MRIAACRSQVKLLSRFYDPKREEGFSLVEILVVMIVIVALMAISWSGFYGLRRSMILHQTAESFRSDVIYAQRSAMLLDRQTEENWIRGIGVNLNDLTASEPTYSVFKWCSDSMQYSDFEPDGGNSTVPDADDSSCKSEAKQFLARKQEVVLAGGGKVEVCFDVKGEPVNVDKDVGYIVFESVTGLVHFFADDNDAIGHAERTYLGTSTGSVYIHFLYGGHYKTVEIGDTGKVSVLGYDSSISNPCPT